MKIERRQLLQLAVGAVALPAVSRVAKAQSYPSRPVRILVGFPAGGTTSTVAQLIGQWLSERFGQPFIIDNRPGAATNIATAEVVAAPADGHTLLQVTNSNAINAALYDRLGFNFLRDVTPVAGISNAPYVMLINPLFSPRTVPEFIAYAKANPGTIKMASAGQGSGPHIVGALFKEKTDLDMFHAPYAGEPPALVDLIDGHVHVYFGTLTASIQFIREAKLRALAVTTAARSEALPNVPIVGDFLPDYEANTWYGIGAPIGMAVEIVEKLNREINSALANPEIKARLQDLGGKVMPGSPTDFARWTASETDRWADAIRATKIKL